uniref:PWWP domain-containing protein n=2 Tax=Cacopsylla melanoneura TaxID=428564 RepID=A0A8D8ZWM6_9HEMI
MPPKKKPTSIKSSPPPQQTQFHISDKVFAQSKDFPIWPAKVIKLHPKSKSPGAKVKVYFYGRRETGDVTLSDLYDYKSSKSHFAQDPPTSKVLSKLFKLALEEIEMDDGQEMGGIEHAMTGQKKRGRKKKYPESGDEGIGVLTEEEDDHTMSAYETADEQVHPVPKKRGRKPKKKPGKRAANSEPKDSSYSQDEDSIHDHTHQDPQSLAASPSSHMSLEPPDTTLNQNLSPMRGHEEGMDKLSATAPLANSEGERTPRCDNEINKLPLLEDGMIPLDHMDKLPAYLLPKDMMATQSKVQEFENLKRSIEKGGALPVEYDTPYSSSGISGLSQPQSEIMNQIKYNNLRIECKMMALEKIIKESLMLDRLNFPRAMARIDAMMALDMTPHMLIRNPELIDTFQRLQRFSVHPSINNIAVGYDLTLASIQAALIRFKAERVMEKIESLFEITPGQTFLEVYCAAKLGQT